MPHLVLVVTALCWAWGTPQTRGHCPCAGLETSWALGHRPWARATPWGHGHCPVLGWEHTGLVVTAPWQVPHEEPPRCHLSSPPALLARFYCPAPWPSCSSSSLPSILQEPVVLRRPEQPLRRHPGPVGSAAPARRGPGLSGLRPGGDRKDARPAPRRGRARARGARVPLQQERALAPLCQQDTRPAPSWGQGQGQDSRVCAPGHGTHPISGRGRSRSSPAKNPLVMRKTRFWLASNPSGGAPDQPALCQSRGSRDTDTDRQVNVVVCLGAVVSM